MILPTTNEVQVLTNAINNYVVRPINAFGLGGFVFDIDGENKIELSADITDHFLEDNTTVQDHIAIKPKKVTLKSYVGELVYRQDESTDTFVQNVTRKLTTINQYLPELTQAAEQAKRLADTNISSFSDAKNYFKENVTPKTINRVSDYWALTKNLINADSRQQQAYLYFKALMEQKILVSLQTPFEYVNNMAIESITAIQPEDSRFISDFSITLKEIRVAEILNFPEGELRNVYVQEMPEELQGRAGIQNESLENLGTVGGQEAYYGGGTLEDMLDSGFLTQEDVDNIINETGNNPVIDQFKAGVITNVNDQ